MPVTTGFNHIATVTADLDGTVAFYEQAFGAVKTFEVAKEPGHPRMAIIDVGGGAAMNIFEAESADDIVGDRRQAGRRGPIDHFGIAVDSLATLEKVRDKLVEMGIDIGEIHQLGDMWSLFFRDPDGMELEVCAPPDPTEDGLTG